MRTEPDHGEQTYRGTGRLEGRKAVITRGTPGSAAQCAVRALPRSEAPLDHPRRVQSSRAVELNGPARAHPPLTRLPPAPGVAAEPASRCLPPD